MKDDPIFPSTEEISRPSEIRAALREAGIEEGISLMLHSSLLELGRPASGIAREILLDALLAAFLDVLGPDGTLFVPTFSFSFCWGQVFDIDRTPGYAMGNLSERVRSDRRSVRSPHANFSVAGVGPLAAPLTRDIRTAFGPGSFHERFGQVPKARLAVLGCGLHYVTRAHHVEACLGVPYRYRKIWSGTLVENGVPRPAFADHFVWDEKKPAETQPDLGRLTESLVANGEVLTAKIGAGQIRTVSVADFDRRLAEGIARDANFAIVGPYLPPGTPWPTA